MASSQKYQAVAGDEEHACEKVAIRDVRTDIIPTNRRGFIVCLSLLSLSLSLNILLLLQNARLRASSRDFGKSIYTGNTYDTLVPFHYHTDFWNPNVSESSSDAAWDNIETNSMAVALHDDFVKKVGLGSSTRFPWDTERSVYYIKGVHDLHCLKLIRKAIVSKHRGDNQNFTMSHIYHCLESLRQDVMCAADDTPLPALPLKGVGEGQLQRCRDWGKLTAWANRPDQNACHSFDDYREATHTLELFGFCPPDSPYRSVMEAYFEYHGHKDPYEPKEDTREQIF